MKTLVRIKKIELRYYICRNIYTLIIMKKKRKQTNKLRIFNKTVILIHLFFNNQFVHAQNPNLQWVASFGTLQDDEGMSVTTDKSGNSYTTGYFQGTVDFDPDTSTFNLRSVGFQDIFITKLNPDGQLIWAKSIGGKFTDMATSIAIDASENIYITGNFRDTADFDPDTTVFNLISNGSQNIFICKLNANGNFSWARSIAAYSSNSLCIDAIGNVLFTGVYAGTVDFNPGAGVNNLTSNGDWDLFVSKLDSNGNYLWAQSMGGKDRDICNAITTDPIGNVYLTGSFSDSVDFDPSTNNYTLIAKGASDIFITKLDVNGSFVFAKRIGENSSNAGQSIHIDIENNIIATGYFQETADFDPNAGVANLSSVGLEDIFILKLDSLGNYIWSKSIGGTLSDIGNSVFTDTKDNVYATGQFKQTVDFDPSTAIYNLTSIGLEDIYIIKLDTAGNFVWAKNFGSKEDELGKSITLDAQDNIYTTGYFRGTVDFDPNSGANNSTSSGLSDIFIHKMNQCTNYTNETLTVCGNFVSPSGKYTWSATGTYNDTLFNIASCDSIITFNLTVNFPTNGIDKQTACKAYKWIDGNIYTSNNNTATFNIIGGAANGCDSLVILDLIVNTANILVSQNNTTLTANAAGAAYQWINCANGNMPINGATNQSYTATSNGSYAVIVTENGCTDTSSCVLLSNVGLSNFSTNSNCIIYPNSFNNFFIVDYSGNNPISFVLTTILGKTLQTGKLKMGINKINLEKEPDGFYFLIIEGSTVKLIKQN